jgi:sigma-B regulation protein RsbU (phosphoserine phosphatase)
MDKKATILIVDDEPYNVDYLEQELEDLGYDTVSAFNGREALEQVAAESPDVILLDITMPVMNGFEALAHLKVDKETRDIPVIVISAMDDMDSVVRGIELGAEDYLPKPFDPVLLHARIRSSLERKWLRDQEQLYLQGLERELEIGRHIQAEFLPSELPQPEGWEIAAFFEAARQVSGDFYDAFILARDGKIGLLVGDVSDKGVGAALYMTLFRTLLRVAASRDEFGIWQNTETTATGSAEIDRGRTLKNAITVTNSYVVENHGQSSMFATIFFGVLDPATGSLLYVNGGHEPPVILNAGEVKEDLPRTGPVVGILPDTSFTVGETQLEPGDTLLIFTDGVTEAQDARGELLGRERLLELLRQPGKGSIPLPDRIAAAVLEYIGDAKQFDDITIVAVQRNSKSN